MSTCGIFNSSDFPYELRVATATTSAAAVFRKAAMAAPLFAFSSQIPKSGNPTAGTETQWDIFDEFIPFVSVTGNVAAPAAGTLQVLDVTTTYCISKGMVLMSMDTMEQMLVEGVLGNQITVRRGTGTVTPTPLPAGATLWSIMTAFEESSLRPPPSNNYVQTSARNYTQIFRKTWAHSGTVEAMQKLLPNEQVYIKSKQDCLIEIAQEVEMAMLYGQAYNGRLMNSPLRKMAGIQGLVQTYAPQNVMVAPRRITYDDFENMTAAVFKTVTDKTSGNDRLLVTDTQGALLFNKLLRTLGTVTFTSHTTSFKMRFTEIVTTVGTFKMIVHPMLDRMPTRGIAMIVDLSSMSLRYLAGRDFDYKVFNPNANSLDGVAQDNGIDATGGTITGEVTLEMSSPTANAIITGLCEVGCAPCIPVTNESGYIQVDRPCPEELEPNTIVVVTVKGKANTALSVMTNTGPITVTTDATGMATFPYTVGTAEVYYFTVVASGDNMTYMPAMATVCVKQPCGEVCLTEPTCPA